MGKHWYLGSADAIYQCLNIIEDERPDIVVVVGADHVYRMDFSQMVDAHIASGAELTVAASASPSPWRTSSASSTPTPRTPPGSAPSSRSPRTPSVSPTPLEVLASMGNYVIDADALVEAVTADAADPDSRHDMGGDIVPAFVARGTAGVYDFIRNDVPGSTDRDRDYWRDVGTLDAYYDANKDLISITPVFNLYNDEWPLHTGYVGLPPPSSCTPGRAAWATPRTRSSPRRHHLRGHGRRLGPVARRLPALVVVRLRLGPHGRCPGGAARAGAPRDPRQERHRHRTCPHRPRPGSGPRPRFHRHRVGHHRRPQGNHR
ncbi:sugar phosphate nucleotidyltransferase [Oerskovia sp. M15]